ncbi:MAG: M48 family metalloprotease [Candidatus Peribacteria bacterium]|nr:MAG: M48 family metalloprotease [Candidatus Peribacteria bacterium]
MVFSQGILDKLDDREIEAVAGHELTHIINKDSLLMIVIVIVIGIIATIGEILFRTGVRMKGGKKNPGPIIALVGLVLLIIGYLIFPLLKLAISRKREFLADAGSVELTKDAHAMVSALQKISGDPIIEQIKQPSIAAMCIANPFGKTQYRFR